MKYHTHEFERVEDYLHHRPPYLLIDEIESIQADEIVTTSVVSADAFYITGHFPGAPVLPGAMMQELSTQTAGVLIAARYNPMATYNTHDPLFNEYALGVLVKVKWSRFRGFVRPGDRLRTVVKLEEIVGEMFEFSATIRRADERVMTNRFQLTNLRSETLRGEVVQN